LIQLLSTSDDNTHTIEPLKVEQIAPDQPGTEQLDQTAASFKSSGKTEAAV
jgi:hypothetical protein